MTSADVESYINRLIDQNPIAIIQYGSSVRQQDFVAGHSDLDLIVISARPLLDTRNNLGCEYQFVHPNTFLAGLAHANMFFLSALQSGVVRHDPHGFMASLHALEASGFSIRTGLTTLWNCIELTLAQLSIALNDYFRPEMSAHAVTKSTAALYRAAKGVGGFCAIADKGFDPHGFSGIVAALTNFPDVAVVMANRKADHLRCDRMAFSARTRTSIESSDSLGAAILEVEGAVLENFCLLPGRVSTNDIIRRVVSSHGPFQRVVAVHWSCHRHLLLAEDERGLRLFGVENPMSPITKFVCHAYGSHDARAAYRALRGAN